jgi:hypothetical protein
VQLLGPRHAVAAVVVASVVAAAGGVSGALADFPDFSAQYTQDTDGNCQDDPIDPVNVLFKGEEAGYANTASQIELHANWPNQDGSAQNLRVNIEGGDFRCDRLATQRANGGSDDSRMHIRLWPIPAARDGDEKKTVGDAHHEDWVSWAPWNPCGAPTGGGHAVDSNGDNGSGFDQGRRTLRHKFDEAGHSTDNDYWGNTRNFEQCDGDLAGSDGTGAVISIGHR